MNKKKKILITGSSGFIGFSLALNLLKKGHKILGYDSINDYYDVNLKLSRNKILNKFKNFSLIKGELEDQKKLNKNVLNFKPEIIIHLAAQAGVRYSLDAPRKYLSSNIIGTFNIIEIAHKIKAKHLLIASSSSVYGTNKQSAFKETDKTDAQLSIYAATKKSTESIAHSYSSLWKIPITMLRFFTVYGPWGRPDMAYFKFTNAIIKNKKIDVYNSGEMYRDFTYIDDVTKSIELLINKAPSQNKKRNYKNDSLSSVAPFRIINIGNQKKVYLKDFISALEKKLGKKANKNNMSMQKGDVKRTLSNTNLLHQIIRYKPKIDYITGISAFINWYKKYYK
ncbi:GDP-mannose 4,6-dehydratase [Candidatus Pelagibacter sp.]|nr:GDP-mannose 4,6-dehydratase [Candidatus Pelagibacter sp.]